MGELSEICGCIQEQGALVMHIQCTARKQPCKVPVQPLCDAKAPEGHRALMAARACCSLPLSCRIALCIVSVRQLCTWSVSLV